MREFEVNCRIQGKGNYNDDFGDLKNIETILGGFISGTYTFYVAAKNNEEALRIAPDVFSSIWEKGIDVGDMQNSELSRYNDGDNEEFRISDSSHLEHFSVLDKENNIVLNAYTGGWSDYNSFYITINGNKCYLI